MMGVVNLSCFHNFREGEGEKVWFRSGFGSY